MVLYGFVSAGRLILLYATLSPTPFMSRPLSGGCYQSPIFKSSCMDLPLAS
jgi:hypothetical protein